MFLILSFAFFIVACGPTRTDEMLKQVRMDDALEKSMYEKFSADGIPIYLGNVWLSRINSMGGVGFSIFFLNKSDKDYKYVFFTVEPYNRVGDVVASSIGGKSKVKAELVGPIDNFYNKNVASYDAVWYNSTIDCMKILNIEIIYMDGTTENVTGSALANILNLTDDINNSRNTKNMYSRDLCR